jgi:hypothetical protein
MNGWDEDSQTYYINNETTSLDPNGNGCWNDISYLGGVPQFDLTTYTGWNVCNSAYYVSGTATSLDSNGYGDYNELHYLAYPTLYQNYDANNNLFYKNGVVYNGWDVATSTYYINGNSTSLNSSGYGDYDGKHYSSYPTLYEGGDNLTNAYYINGDNTGLNASGYGDYNGNHYSTYPTLYQGYDSLADQYYVNGQVVDKVYGCMNPTAYNYNPLANMNSGCISIAQLPKYFLPNIEEWFRSAFYDPTKPSKYWAYSNKTDDAIRVCASDYGDGINCADYGICRPYLPNDICGCAKTWKTNNTIYLDPELNSDYNKDIVELNYTGSGCNIGFYDTSYPLTLTYNQKISPNNIDLNTTLPMFGLKINSSGSGPIVIENIGGITKVGHKLIHLSGSNSGVNIIGLIQNYDLFSNGNVSVLKTGSGTWYFNRSTKYYNSIGISGNLGANVYSGPTFIREGTAVGVESTAQGGGGGSFGQGSTFIRIGNVSVTDVNFVAILLVPNVQLGRTIFVEPPVPNYSQKVILGSTKDIANFYGSDPLPPSVIDGTIRLSRDITIQAATDTTLNFNPTLTNSNGIGVPSFNYIFGTDNNYGIIRIGSSGSMRTTGIITIYAGTVKTPSLPSSPSMFTVGLSSSINAVLDFSSSGNTNLFSLANTQTLKGNGTIVINNNSIFTINGTLYPSMLTLSGIGAIKTSGTTRIDINGSSRGVDGYGAMDLINGSTLNFFNGVLQLNFNSELANNTVLELFKTYDSSSFMGNFSSITVTGTSSLSSATFTLGQNKLWTSSISSNNQYMTFDGNAGVLNILSSLN